MALTPPPINWKTIKLGRDEFLWTVLMIIMILMMGLMTVGYVFLGDQNVPEQYREVPVEDLFTTFRAGNDASGATLATMRNGEPGLELLSGGDLYLYARQWNWTVPFSGGDTSGIKIKIGETYRLHVGSVDVLHGFQLIGSNFIISIQVVPGFDYIIDFIPNETGLFRIICNEYCGTAHHEMLGFMEVVA